MCHLYRLRINTHVLSKYHALHSLLYRATQTLEDTIRVYLEKQAQFKQQVTYFGCKHVQHEEVSKHPSQSLPSIVGTQSPVQCVPARQ